ncbi:hypothetical protein IMCC3317_34650 [Kordia antarctica]|uniref:Uncharacterized protein n=1 Tax=Kordia antarctica TaxID=1218801 RepID=A0A7L4ZNK3_9FLAO|nr:hypothetical protein [Kordia antarctica]QHI38080.1 hypothetical protein IMCC3317_34650 [Kordia antarctica]
MLKNYEHIEELLIDATKEQLYEKLIAQLNKDFTLANIEESFSQELKPDELKTELHEIVYRLIQEKFAEYLNLLYIMDVSEAKIKALDGSDMLQLSENVVLLMLKREWQKVWFKNKL